MNNVRDTHFQGFAKLLTQELDEMKVLKMTDISASRVLHQVQQLLAQRAYDLVEYALENQPIFSFNLFPDNAEVIGEIPDLTEWPKP